MINIYKRYKNKYKFSHNIDSNGFANIIVFLGKNSSINNINVMRSQHKVIYIKVGDNTTINDMEFLHSPQSSKYYVKIGSNCKLGNFLKIEGSISISDHVSIGNNTSIYRNVKIHPHVRVDSTVTLGKNVILGNNSYVKFGSDIKDNSIIRPYDVVVSSISMNSTYYYDEYIKDFRFIGDKNRNLIRKYNDLRAKQKQMESS
jgi:carbonic anhydrase/acetyltransferase-like protein (isoleucine patch superfamily)